MEAADAIAKQFTTFYYMTFETDRGALLPLYRDTSMLSWEGQYFKGGAAIVEKLNSLAFSKVSHRVTTLDTQPSSENNLVVLVTGHLNVDESTNPIQFTQLFHLVAEAESFYVLNDVFRLIYG